MPASGSCSAAGSDKATERDFVSIVVPCLQLVAPVGMTADAQDAWLEAARIAIGSAAVDDLRAGARIAMQSADHPSKVVPLIAAEVNRRRATTRSIERVREGAASRPGALSAPGAERPVPSEVDEICRRFGVGRYARPEHRAASPHTPADLGRNPDRPCRAPTRTDYLRMGVLAETLDGMGLTA